MPIRPSPFERLLLSREGQGADAFVDLLAAAAFRALAAAHKLGVFESLAHDPKTPLELATDLKADPPGISRLVAFLEVAGYVRRTGERFSNSRLTSRWLLPDVPRTEIDTVELFDGIFADLWSDAAIAIKDGRPVRHFHEWLSGRPGGWELFERAMRVQAGTGAERVARQVRIPSTARTLVDVAGGHGLFAVAFCKRHPRLRAVIFDLPEAEAAARVTIDDQSLADRIRFVAGDFRVDAIPTHDVALLSRMLHYSTEAENRDLFGRIAESLAPDGLVIVLDRFTDATAWGPLFSAMTAMLDLNYYLTLGGRLYATSDVRRWLNAAGLRDVQVKRLRGGPYPLAVSARKDRSSAR